MIRCLKLSFAFLAVAWFVLPSLARAEDTKELKPIATVKSGGQSKVINPNDPNSGSVTPNIGSFELETTGVVVRNAEELVALTSKAKSSKDAAVQKEMETELAKLLKVETVDWNKQMVLGMIAEGFESLKIDGKVLIVTYVPFNMLPLRGARQDPPKNLVLVERFEGEVKFVKKKKEK
jgi:hypothetical protein